MKFYLRYITVILAFFCYTNSYAVTDSLPPCIDSIKKKTAATVEEYDYKGQRWFVIAPKAKIPVPNNSDQMFYIKFYDNTCRLVCTWTKGGIAGFNKVAPDTIEKEKILRITTLDSLQKNTPGLSSLPDTIIKIGLSKNSTNIQQYYFNGQMLYSINKPLTPGMRQELLAKGINTVDESYYDKTGKIIILHKRALEGSFMRSDQWIPYSVKGTDIITVQHGNWVNKGGKFKNETMLKPVIK